MKRLIFGVLAAAGAVGAGIYWCCTICRHKLSRVFTVSRKEGGKLHYKVCFRCGKEFEYDLTNNQLGKQIDVKSLKKGK